MKVTVKDKKMNEVVDNLGTKLIEKTEKGDDLSQDDLKSLVSDIAEFKSAWSEYSEKDEFLEERKQAMYGDKSEVSDTKAADAYILGKMLNRGGGDIFNTSLGQEVKKDIISDANFRQRFSTGILQELEQELTVSNKFEVFNFSGAANWRIPYSDEDTNRPSVLKPGVKPSSAFAQPGSDNVASFAQTSIGAVLLNPSLFQRSYTFSQDEEETSLIPFIPYLRQQAARSFARYRDETILRGDNSIVTFADPPTQNQSPFYGITALAENVAGDALKQFTGANGASVSLSNVVAARKTMGKYGINPRDLVLFLNIDSYNDLVDATDVRTVDQYGPGATILTGELARVYNIPVFISEFLDDNGDATESNNTVGALVYRPGFAVGQLNDFHFESEFQPATRYWTNYISSRYDFTALNSVAEQNLSADFSMAISLQTGDSTI